MPSKDKPHHEPKKPKAKRPPQHKVPPLSGPAVARLLVREPGHSTSKDS